MKEFYIFAIALFTIVGGSLFVLNFIFRKSIVNIVVMGFGVTAAIVGACSYY